MCAIMASMVEDIENYVKDKDLDSIFKQILVKFFKDAKCKNMAGEYADAVIDDDDENDVESLQILLGCKADAADPTKCKELSEKQKDEFMEAIEDYGITKRMHKMKIVKALGVLPPPREPTPYLLGSFGGENLQHVQKEHPDSSA